MPETVNNKLILKYSGEINYDNIGVLLNKLKHKMEEYGFKLGVYKKVLSVMVECLENIYKYLDTAKISNDKIETAQPYFNLEYIDNYFNLKAGNPLLKEDINKLEKKINEINKLDNQDLRKLYKKIITDGKFTDKGGAGLGFIEMIKTTGTKLDISFEEINSELSFFHLAINIPIN